MLRSHSTTPRLNTNNVIFGKNSEDYKIDLTEFYRNEFVFLSFLSHYLYSERLPRELQALPGFIIARHNLNITYENDIETVSFSRKTAINYRQISKGKQEELNVIR